jgi:S1-C subfamily serine protease
MSTKEIFDRVKKATVAIVIAHPEKLPKKPFTIVGSGFCIHPQGIVVTCEHVFKSFVDPEAYKKVMAAAGEVSAEPMEVKSIVPHAVFHSHIDGTQVHMIPVPIVNAITKTNFDLAAFKLHPHKALAGNFPTLPIADYAEIHEMMEIGLCGYPLGNVLQEQLGTATSSFTKGVISSIIPAPGIACEHLRGFQLNLTATNGNSGGPVFSLATGHVFGVLQRGLSHPGGYLVQGLTKAEPIYPILEHNSVDRLLLSQDEFIRQLPRKSESI